MKHLFTLAVLFSSFSAFAQTQYLNCQGIEKDEVGEFSKVRTAQIKIVDPRLDTLLDIGNLKLANEKMSIQISGLSPLISIYKISRTNQGTHLEVRADHGEEFYLTMYIPVSILGYEGQTTKVEMSRTLENSDVLRTRFTCQYGVTKKLKFEINNN